MAIAPCRIFSRCITKQKNKQFDAAVVSIKKQREEERGSQIAIEASQEQAEASPASIKRQRKDEMTCRGSADCVDGLCRETGAMQETWKGLLLANTDFRSRCREGPKVVGFN